MGNSQVKYEYDQLQIKTSSVLPVFGKTHKE